MPCLIVILALLLPRVVLVLLWLLTDWVGWAFGNPILPILGFLFLPYTTLAYTGAVVYTNRAIDLPWLIVVIVAIVVDIGHLAGTRYARRRP